MTLLLAIIVGLCGPSPMDGQRLTRRSGLWLSAGADFAYGKANCRVCNADAAWGPAGVVQIGGSPSQKALVSIELSYWNATADTTAQEYALAMAAIRYYPVQRGPFFVIAGFGVGRYAEERVSPTGASWSLSANGFSFEVGAGYEFPLTGRIKIGPVARYISAGGHKVKLNQLGESRDMTGRWLRVGAQVTWR